MKKLSAFLLVLLAACWGPDSTVVSEMKVLDSDALLGEIAEAYVHLVLALGVHDGDFVDAYYGPRNLREEVEVQQLSLDEIAARIELLSEQLATTLPSGSDLLVTLRHTYLTKQLSAVAAKTHMLSGQHFTFDQESKKLYDAIAPTHDAAHFDQILEELKGLIPGEGPLSERLTAYKSKFVIPVEKLDLVFMAAIEESRKRTRAHLDLPEQESFVVEYVKDKAWSGYNWYKGEFQSLIQVNTDLPIFIDRAIDLACHEGYPGHHVYNMLLEKHLVKKRGWIEFTVYPLFSPQSLIAEGSANFGIEVAFPKDERVAFEMAVLFPLAGLDPSEATNYYRVQELLGRLKYAGNEAARGFLDGKLSEDQAVAWLRDYGLQSEERARQRLSFIKKYRAYVINYNLGQDLVAKYVNAKGGTEDDPAARWRIFEELISSPRLPSGLSVP